MQTTFRYALALAAVLLAALLLRADGPPPKEKPKKAAPKKVYTEEDLRSTRGVISVGTPDEPAPAETATGEGQSETAAAGETAGKPKPEPTEEERRDQRRKELQSELDYQVANVKALQQQLNDAQAELNDLTNLTLSADQTGGRRAALIKLVEDATREIKAGQAKIEELEDKARREGIRLTRP